MRFSLATAAIIGAVAASPQWGPQGGNWGPQSNSTDVYVTEVVTAFTTFCPEATMITHGGSTYTISSATTLTITNCPGGCTITKPVTSSVVTSCSTCSTPAPPMTTPMSSVPTAPVPMKSSSVSASPVYPTGNGTAPVMPTGTGSVKPSGSTVPYTGAAGKVTVAGAGFLALFGLVAAL